MASNDELIVVYRKKQLIHKYDTDFKLVIIYSFARDLYHFYSASKFDDKIVIIMANNSWEEATTFPLTKKIIISILDLNFKLLHEAKYKMGFSDFSYQMQILQLKKSLYLLLLIDDELMISNLYEKDSMRTLLEFEKADRFEYLKYRNLIIINKKIYQFDDDLNLSEIKIDWLLSNVTWSNDWERISTKNNNDRIVKHYVSGRKDQYTIFQSNTDEQTVCHYHLGRHTIPVYIYDFHLDTLIILIADYNWSTPRFELHFHQEIDDKWVADEKSFECQKTVMMAWISLGCSYDNIIISHYDKINIINKFSRKIIHQIDVIDPEFDIYCHSLWPEKMLKILLELDVLQKVAKSVIQLVLSYLLE